MEVERFVESDAKMDSLGRIGLAMPMLARLHDALASSHLPEAADHLRFGNYVAATNLMAATAEGSSRIRALDGSPDDLADMADMADALARELSEAQGSLADLEDQWCHGDYWDNNVLFRDDQVALVADFGFMNRRPRVDDLALTLYFTLWELDLAGYVDPSGALRALVDAYDDAARRPLSDAERAVLPLALARQPLWSIAVWAAQLDVPEAVKAHLHGHETALRLAEHIVADLSRWREAFAR